MDNSRCEIVNNIVYPETGDWFKCNHGYVVVKSYNQGIVEFEIDNIIFVIWIEKFVDHMYRHKAEYLGKYKNGKRTILGERSCEDTCFEE